MASVPSRICRKLKTEVKNVFKATLKNRSSAHLAPVTITFPIPEAQYEQTILTLEKSQIGDARVQDCLIDNVHAPNCPALNRMIGTMANVDELDWLGKQLESFDRYELLQFNAAVERFGLSAADELIDLSFCAREVTVVSDFKDLELVGKRHYDNAESWRLALLAHQNDFAETMQIPPEHLRWYAAFHDEGEHPHIHMMLWSDDPQYGFLRKDRLLHMQSVLTNTIYADELKEIYIQKDVAYKEVTEAAREVMRELVDRIGTIENPPESIQQRLLELALELRTVSGKKQYAYLKSRLKIWWIPSWMSWKSCRRWRRTMLHGTACATRWRAIIKTGPGSTIHSHSRKNFERSRTRSFRRPNVCGSRWSSSLRKMKNRLWRKLHRTLLQIRRL